MITFTLDYPITGKDSLNTVYSGKHWTKRKKYKDSLCENILWQIKAQKIKSEILEKPVVITFTFPFDKIDIDNHGYFSKCVIDCIKGIFIKEDDPAHVWEFTQKFKKVDKNLVTVEEIE